MLMRPDGGLTRQGRLARTFLFLALVVTGLVVGSQAVAAGEEEPQQTDTYTVSPGETLWGIATTLRGPGEDTRDIIEEIIALNGLERASISAGEQILIPVSS
ncbi:MAG: LysM peptidoglycan-binding domain-containing protein [Demequinaceae bacterium]|nr:LysM peptidoglycan-binding domain-containing protein [Demequinaceae bacterium]